MPSRYREDNYPTTTQPAKLIVSGPNYNHQWDYTHTRRTDDYRRMSDEVTADFMRKIASGAIINNNVFLTKHHIEYRPGSASWTIQNGKYIYDFSGSVEIHFGSGQMPPDPEYSLIDMSTLRFRALSRIDSTPYQMMEDVFEIKQTLGFLRNPLKAILNLGSSFKRDVRKTMRRRRISRGRATASVWLEYRFALMPLVRSAYDIVESLQKEFEFPERRTARCYRSRYDDEYSSFSQYGNQWIRKASIDQEAGAGVLYSITNPAGEFRSTYGLRGKDIPVTLWAVFPLSFMIDRLIDISGSIRGLTALLDPSVSIHAGWTMRKMEIKKSSTLVDHPKDDFTSSSGGKHDFLFTYTRETWDPSALDAIPSITPMNLANSVFKVMDLIALITQRFK